VSTNPELYDYGYGGNTALPPLDRLEGMKVCDVNGDKIGKVEDVYSDPDGTSARYLAVQTGWLGTKRHMIPVDDVRLQVGDGSDDPYLAVPYSKDIIEEGPAYDRDEDFTRTHEEQAYGHYGRRGYWDIIEARQTEPAPTPEIAEAEVTAAINRGEDPNQVAVKRWGV
jgi:sporulation protein YlmC with PRC-barrel domain